MRLLFFGPLLLFILLPSPIRGGKGAVGGYYAKCSGPEGYPGTCKPLAACAQYYATPANYDYDHSHYYKSCNYGMGERGACCPDVYATGYKPSVINYNPKKYGDYKPQPPKKIPAHAIQKAVAYAVQYQDRYYRTDKALGRGEDDDSYWGNGVAQPIYQKDVRDYADTGYFLTLVTSYLQREYGYQPESAFGGGGLRMVEYSQYLPEKYRRVCHSYYKKCRPSRYRSYDGSCNNIKNPYYGQALSSVGHIKIPSYSDRVHGLKLYGRDGSPLPMPRGLRTYALPDKNVEEKEVNMMFVNYGQFVVHDVSHVPFYQADDGLFVDCCFGYQGGEKQVNPKCYAVPLPQNDEFYRKHKQTCLNMARAVAAPNAHCAVGYAGKLNYATSFLDCSLIYGTSKNLSTELRTGSYGQLKTTQVGDQAYLPIDKEAECFKPSADFCFKSGDLRTTLHPGLTLLQTVGMRFHNFCAQRLAKMNKHWSDDRLFEECRRITIAVFQHITYTEYLPLVLGWKFMYDYGILPPTRGYSYDYNERTNPWTLAEWTAAAFRLHSSVYGTIALVNSTYQPERFERLDHHYNSALLYKNPNNFDKLVRGYIWARQRRVDEYYDDAVGDLLLKDHRPFGLDLPTFNIHRGRDYGLGSYNDYRELCGLPRARNWHDFHDVIDPDVVSKFSKVYRSPDDVELYPGGVVEKHVRDSVLGPTWWCIAGYQFQSWRRSDRYFYTEGGHPHSFTLPQLDEIRKMSLAALLCLTTGLQEVPVFAMRTASNGNPMVRCQDYHAVPRMSFGPWKNQH